MIGDRFQAGGAAGRDIKGSWGKQAPWFRLRLLFFEKFPAQSACSSDNVRLRVCGFSSVDHCGFITSIDMKILTIHDGKGQKNRIASIPESLMDELRDNSTESLPGMRKKFTAGRILPR